MINCNSAALASISRFGCSKTKKSDSLKFLHPGDEIIHKTLIQTSKLKQTSVKIFSNVS